MASLCDTSELFKPSIVEHFFVPWVIGIVYDSDTNGYFFSCKLFDPDSTYVEKNLGFKPTIGFHSVYTGKK